VSRTCNAANGGWSGSAISCNACSAPGAGFAIQVSKPAADTWRYQCAPGYYASTYTDLVCNTYDGSFSGNAQPSCVACGGSGVYCPGGTVRLSCPPG
jgi:hypothetical protein